MKSLPRANTGDFVALSAEVWNRLCDAVEKSDRLTVAAPLFIQDSPVGKAIGIKLSSGGKSNFRKVVITTDGGGAGDDTGECSFTYSFTVDSTDYTEVAMTGHGRRNPLGAMTAGSVGFVWYDADSKNWQLVWADEQPEIGVCDDSGTDPFLF